VRDLLKPVTAGHATPARACSAGSIAGSKRQGALCRHRGLVAQAHRAADADLRSTSGRTGLGFARLPGGFLPVDDQGFITPTCRRPPSSSYARTEAAVPKRWKNIWRSGRRRIRHVPDRFSFLGQGINTAQAFITLKDWSERGAKDSAAAIVADINRDLASIRDAKISALQPPPIDNLGNSSGFSFRLQDRGRMVYAGAHRSPPTS
jgi:multidrug efflux pump